MDGGKVDFIGLLKDFLAVAAPSGAALRNQERGVLKTVQQQLAEVQLEEVPSDSAHSYCLWLDHQTLKMLNAMTVEVEPWGAARKALNLFMRACICDHYLRARYQLETIERWAEIPLDSIVARELRRKALEEGHKLPAWPGLKKLTKEQNDRFQAFAAEYAQELDLPARVYLDNYLWLKNR